MSKCRDGEVPSQKKLSSHFEELLVAKFLVKRNLVPQMRNFSPTLSILRGIGSRRMPGRISKEGLISHLLIGKEGEGNEVMESGRRLLGTGCLSLCWVRERNVANNAKLNFELLKLKIVPCG